jgi:D-xylose transport system substrate-binding protein
VAAAGKIKLAYEADAKDWLASNRQREVEQALTATNDKIDAIIATNDTLAQASSRR